MDKTITIQCIDCKTDFDFSAAEQRFYEEKQFSQPLRCKKCREIKKTRYQENDSNKNRYYSAKY